jgi:hypothetical protein
MPSAMPIEPMAPPAETPSGGPAITASISTSTEPSTPTPGPRAAAFLQLYDKTLTTTLRTISYEAFSACFPNLSESAPETLRAFHGQMIERLGAFAKVCLLCLFDGLFGLLGGWRVAIWGIDRKGISFRGA